MVDLSGQAAIVTGGASGIGRATALLLARHGAHVVIGDLRLRPENDSILAEHAIVQQSCDVRRDADIANLVAVGAGLGRLTIVVSNAGVGLVKQIPDVTEQEWDDCLDTNFKASFLLARHAIPHMRAAGGGSFVVTSSNAGILPRAHDPVYSISKGALIALVKSLALCHASDRIRFNAVCPGPVDETGMMADDLANVADPAALRRQFIAASPLARAAGRMISPEEVAEAVRYLISDAAAMITGTAIAIDGGKSLGVPPQML